MGDVPGQESASAGTRDRRGPGPEAEPLWREVVGRRLRAARRRQGRTLAETARRAGISTQYLSEIERGRKDASSEIIAAVAGALGYSLGEIAWMAAADLLAAAGLTAAGRPALMAAPGDADGDVRFRRRSTFDRATPGLPTRSPLLLAA